MIVAGTALLVALAGTALAGPSATKTVLAGKDKKQVRKIARSEVAKAASGLSVADSKALGGIGSAGFIQGGGRLIFGGTDVPAGGAATPVVTVPGLARLDATCSANSQSLTWTLNNLSGAPRLFAFDAQVQAAAGSATPQAQAVYQLPNQPQMTITTNGGSLNPGSHRVIGTLIPYTGASGPRTTFVITGFSMPASSTHCTVQGYAAVSG